MATPEITKNKDKEKVDAMEATKETIALQRCRLDLKIGLAAIHMTIAQHCNANGLIDDDIYDAMFEDHYKPQKIRSLLFIRCIISKLQQIETIKNAPDAMETDDVHKIIKQLANIIREDCALKHIAQILGKCKIYINNLLLLYLCIDDCENAVTFKQNSTEIVDGIQNDLSRIATKALSEDIITNAVYNICVNPTASKEDTCTDTLLQEVSKEVKHNPKQLYTFIKILQKRGEPISHYGDRICKLIKP